MSSGLRRAVIVVDTQFHVQRWNDRAEDLSGLRCDEVVGRSLLSFDSGLPVPELGDAFDGRAPRRFEILARNRRGQRIRCCTMVSARYDDAGEVAGALLLMRAEVAAEA